MSEQEDKAQSDTSGPSPPHPDNTQAAAGSSIINRRSRWASSFAAWRYIQSVQRDQQIKVRDSDKATAISLVLCCIGAIVCLLVPGFETYKEAFVLAADVLIGISLFMYVVNRFGIVTTFLPRQALLTWQLMLGSSLMAIFMTINLAVVISYIVQRFPIIVP